MAFTAAQEKLILHPESVYPVSKKGLDFEPDALDNLVLAALKKVKETTPAHIQTFNRTFLTMLLGEGVPVATLAGVLGIDKNSSFVKKAQGATGNSTRAGYLLDGFYASKREIAN